jgi:hypothetical protein
MGRLSADENSEVMITLPQPSHMIRERPVSPGATRFRSHVSIGCSLLDPTAAHYPLTVI